MTSPYEDKKEKAFWKFGVASKRLNSLEQIYKPKFKISKDMKVVALGSCFAQHIARNMKLKGYTVVDVEPAPPGLTPPSSQRFGFDLFSARVGNIYVVRQLLQLYEEAQGLWQPAEPVWENCGRFYDSMRPSVEPGGLESPDLVMLHRQKHLESLRRMFFEAEVVIFTMGLTESWMHRESGDVFPTAPGTIAGAYNSGDYQFKNFTFTEIYNDFVKFINYLKEINPDIKFLLTVSPVPLTATATDKHVLVASTYSKSVLRSVAGQLADEYESVDYFPSYDIIASVLAGEKAYLSNLRSVAPETVSIAMNTFFSANSAGGSAPANREKLKPDLNYDKENGSLSPQAEEEFCEDVLLEVFGK